MKVRSRIQLLDVSNAMKFVYLSLNFASFLAQSKQLRGTLAHYLHLSFVLFLWIWLSWIKEMKISTFHRISFYMRRQYIAEWFNLALISSKLTIDFKVLCFLILELINICLWWLHLFVWFLFRIRRSFHELFVQLFFW